METTQITTIITSLAIGAVLGVGVTVQSQGLEEAVTLEPMVSVISDDGTTAKEEIAIQIEKPTTEIINTTLNQEQTAKDLIMAEKDLHLQFCANKSAEFDQKISERDANIAKIQTEVDKLPKR